MMSSAMGETWLNCGTLRMPRCSPVTRTADGALFVGSLRGIAAAEVVAALAAHALHVHVDAGLGIKEALRRLEQVGVEAPGQATIAGDDDEDDVALLARLQQGMLGLAGLGIDHVGALTSELQHVGQHLRVGTGGQGAFLSAAELGGRDHLHGLGNLPRALHAADTAPDIQNVRHIRSLWQLPLSEQRTAGAGARQGSVPLLP